MGTRDKMVSKDRMFLYFRKLKSIWRRKKDWLSDSFPLSKPHVLIPFIPLQLYAHFHSLLY